jgi:hypothetical protein
MHLLILAVAEMAETVFTPCLEGMKHVRSETGVVLAKPFLDVCKQILPVLGTSLRSCLP